MSQTAGQQPAPTPDIAKTMTPVTTGTEMEKSLALMNQWLTLFGVTTPLAPIIDEEPFELINRFKDLLCTTAPTPQLKNNFGKRVVKKRRSVRKKSKTKRKSKSKKKRTSKKRRRRSKAKK
jgi:hypothetical protein